MSDTRRAIAVVGAGIGGLTAALTLAAAGYHVTVVERSASLSEIGAGIQIAPNAGRILAQLGLSEAMRTAAIEPEAIDIRSALTGRRVTSIPAGAFRARYGFPYYVIHRADLQRILATAVAANPRVDLLLGATAEDAREDGDRIVLTVAKADGSDELTVEAIIGADGVRSTLRYAITDSARPVPIGRTAWRGVVPAEAARHLIPANRVGLWFGPRAHLVHYPMADHAAVNVVAIVEDRWEESGWNVPGEPAELIAHFRSWASEARTLLAAPKAWQKYALMSVEPDGPWCTGRIALLGDAAHAMAPFLAQGAAMAIEDAAVLAARLKNATDIPAALRAYATARQPRVARVAAASKQTGSFYHLSGPISAARDLSLGLLGKQIILDRQDWLYGWRAPEPVSA